MQLFYYLTNPVPLIIKINFFDIYLSKHVLMVILERDADDGEVFTKLCGETLSNVKKIFFSYFVTLKRNQMSPL